MVLDFVELCKNVHFVRCKRKEFFQQLGKPNWSLRNQWLLSRDAKPFHDKILQIEIPISLLYDLSTLIHTFLLLHYELLLLKRVNLMCRGHRRMRRLRVLFFIHIFAFVDMGMIFIHLNLLIDWVNDRICEFDAFCLWFKSE